LEFQKRYPGEYPKGLIDYFVLLRKPVMRGMPDAPHIKLYGMVAMVTIPQENTAQRLVLHPLYYKLSSRYRATQPRDVRYIVALQEGGLVVGEYTDKTIASTPVVYMLILDKKSGKIVDAATFIGGSPSRIKVGSSGSRGKVPYEHILRYIDLVFDTSK
jgi:hypothetical protein